MRVIVVEDDVDFFVLRLIGQPVVEETAEAEIGGVVAVIDAKNEKVAGWYASYGAAPLLDAPLSLVLPLAMMEAALRKAGKYRSD